MPSSDLIQRARALLEDVTPLSFNCGTLCGHKCCTDYTPDVGVYLIPGELPLFDGTESWATWQFHRTDQYDFAPEWDRFRQIPFLKCSALCDRSRRPFECRTYPLVPFLEPDGQISMRYSPWAEGICPLTARYRLVELQPVFVARCREAWTLLITDSDMLAHVRWLTEQLTAWEELPHIDDNE